MVETEKKRLIDNAEAEEVQKKLAQKINSARKAIKLFESGKVEAAYNKALKEAKAIPNEMERDFKVSIIEEEQQNNIKVYAAAKIFIKNYSQYQ